MRLIDADALKETLGMKNDCSECGEAWKACHYDRIYPKLDFCEWIDDAPTIHPEPPKMGKWIPCKERLPEELSEVNVTWVNTSPPPYYEFVKGKPNTGSAVYYKGRWYWYSAVCVDYLKEYGYSPGDGMDDAIKIIAWRPFPEPYKEGNDGND